MPKKEKALLGLVVFFISFSALTIEIIYSRIFSVLTYYHFSSMIISIALLGFGAAGSYMSIKYNKQADVHKFIRKNMLYFLLSNVISFYFIIKLRFYPIELSGDWTNNLSLLFYYVALAVPFFFAGKILSYIFTRFSSEIGTLYFFDLIGGGLGSLSVFFFLSYYTGPEIIHLVSVILAGILVLYTFTTNKKKVFFPLFILLSVFFVFQDIHSEQKMLIHPPPSKEGFKWSPPWKGKVDIEYSKWNVIERLDITKSFRRRIWDFGGDISRKYNRETMELRYMFKDGIASTGILKVDKPISEYQFLEGYLQAAPYHLKRYRSVISIGFGGGIDLWIAAYHKLSHIIGVEINPLKIHILKNEYREYSGDVARRTILVPEEGRYFLSRIKTKVDVIQMSGLDSSPALSSGAFAMSENYVFTREAVQVMLSRLNEDGVISINRIIFSPPRETLRMVSTMVAAMQNLGIDDLSKHFLILRGNRWANILLKINEFTEGEVSNLKRWATEMDFRIIYDPFMVEQSNIFNKFIHMNKEDRKVFIDQYPYKISPSTDDSPFFFQYYKWGNLFKENLSTWSYAIHMPVGLKIIIYSIIQITILGLVFILVPLRKKKISLIPGISLNSLTYFSSIGLGFIIIEIILIQKFIVFLGGPLYSLSVVLFSILVFTGLGSFVSKKILGKSEKMIPALFISIVVLSLAYSFFLLPVLNHFMHLPTIVRVLISILILAPLSFLMGMPFPTGIRILSGRFNQLIPWAWAANSIFTVFGSVFCLFLSITFGFRISWMIALIFYLLAFLAFSRLRIQSKA